MERTLESELHEVNYGPVEVTLKGAQTLLGFPPRIRTMRGLSEICRMSGRWGRLVAMVRRRTALGIVRRRGFCMGRFRAKLALVQHLSI